MSLLSHQWLWLSMECYGLMMHGEYVCVFDPLKDTAIITYVMGGFKGACVCMWVMAFYVSIILGILWIMLLKRPRILKGITIALCEPLNLVFIRSIMCVIFLFLLCILQDSVCLSVGWCSCSVSLLSPGQHCFLHSAALWGDLSSWGGGTGEITILLHKWWYATVLSNGWLASNGTIAYMYMYLF